MNTYNAPFTTYGADYKATHTGSISLDYSNSTVRGTVQLDGGKVIPVHGTNKGGGLQLRGEGVWMELDLQSIIVGNNTTYAGSVDFLSEPETYFVLSTSPVT